MLLAENKWKTLSTLLGKSLPTIHVHMDPWFKILVAVGVLAGGQNETYLLRQDVFVYDGSVPDTWQVLLV